MALNDSDKDNRPYTLPDLVVAVNNYSHAKGIYDEAQRMVESKKKELDHFERTAGLAYNDVERQAVNVQKIVRNLERK